MTSLRTFTQRFTADTQTNADTPTSMEADPRTLDHLERLAERNRVRKSRLNLDEAKRQQKHKHEARALLPGADISKANLKSN